MDRRCRKDRTLKGLVRLIRRQKEGWPGEAVCRGFTRKFTFVPTTFGKVRLAHDRARTFFGVISFVFLLFCSHTWAQEFTGEIITEKTSFQVNEEFKFTIHIPDISPSKLVIEEPKFPNGIEVIAGPSKRPGINGSIVDYTFKLNKTGRYIIDSFALRSSNGIMHTPPVFITASGFTITGNIDKVPPFARWDIPKDNYYPGEIVPLQIIIENIENPNAVIETEVSQKKEGYIKKGSRNAEQNEKKVIVKKIMEGEIYDLLFHDHIFVPFRPGNIILPDMEIYLSEGEEDFVYRIILKGEQIVISGLPESEENTGALGHYSYEYEISDNKISDLQVVILKQKISGTGNFYGITMPAPYISNPEIADISLIQDKYDVTPQYKLFNGSRELIYSIRKKANEQGYSVSRESSESTEYLENISVIIPDFSWYLKNSFEPLLEWKQEKIPGKAFILNIEETSFTNPASDINQPERERIIKKVLTEILKIILIISIIPFLFFVIKKKFKKSIIALLVILSVFIGFLIIKKVFVKEAVYGVVNHNTSHANIYLIPEEYSAIKFTVENGEKVRIIGEKEQFYLIETEGNGSRGWVKKENIIH